MSYESEDDQWKVSVYNFARGAEYQINKATLDALLAKLPEGTDVEIESRHDKVFNTTWYTARVTEPLKDFPKPELTSRRMINYGRYEVRHPWPFNITVQGGGGGLVFRGSDTYRTAFFEAFPDEPSTFIRGEGETIAEAEDKAWAHYERITAGDHEHEFERRGYTNGLGFCKHCNMSQSKAFDPIVFHCEDCGDEATHDIGKFHWCSDHGPQNHEERTAVRQHLKENGDDYSRLEELFDAFRPDDN